MVELMIYTLLFIIALIAMSIIINKIEHAMYLRETVASIQYAIKHKNGEWEEELLP